MVLVGKTYSAASTCAIKTGLDMPSRSFDLFCAVYVNKSTDAVAKLARTNGKIMVEAMEFVTPGLPGDRSKDKRKEHFEEKGTGFNRVPELAMATLRL